ncbi:prepilin-type N-terminal cleavage/methylation domain-containing protein [Eisenbergiella sp.]
MKKDYRNKGFTLVEMIVVIVIIGILLAILVPGMFRYIQKAKEQQAIVECRAVVTATETLIYELYGKNSFDYPSYGGDFLNDYSSEILEKADVRGKISSINFSANNFVEIIYLKYISQSNLIVIYEPQKSVVYRIETNDFGDFNTRLDYANKLISSKKWNDAKQSFYDSDYASLTDYEKNIFKNLKVKFDINNYRWIPSKYQENGTENICFIAVPKALNGNNASLIYINGNYYYWKGKNIYDADSHWLDDQRIDPSLFNDTYCSNDDLSNVKEQWIKVVK